MAGCRAPGHLTDAAVSARGRPVQWGERRRPTVAGPRGEKGVLRVTNGDCAADGVRRFGLSGEVLAWRDVLHEGPVPAGLFLDELWEVRARFVAEWGWGDFGEVMGDLARRDAMLSGFGDHEEVVVLFEHDLYDQLQLIQLLDWFGRRALGSTRLSVVHASEYLGPAAPEGLCALLRDRREVSARELERGSWSSGGRRGRLSARRTPRGSSASSGRTRRRCRSWRAPCSATCSGSPQWRTVYPAPRRRRWRRSRPARACCASRTSPRTGSGRIPFFSATRSTPGTWRA